MLLKGLGGFKYSSAQSSQKKNMLEREMEWITDEMK